MQPKFFIIAGEPSGDLIGSRLIKALKELNPGSRIFGVGGEKMQAQGLSSIFPMEDISVMGYTEILARLPRIYKRLNQTYQSITRIKPDIIITIDSPGFNYKIAKKVRQHFGRDIKLVNYVAPSVWAYKPERVHRVAELFDHQLLILPIEKPYFDAINFPSTFVGHPLLEEKIAPISDKEAIFDKYGIPLNNKLITIMPGSRRGELNRHIPIFRKALEILQTKIPNFSLFIPTLASFEDELKNKFGQFPAIISSASLVKEELFAASDIALVKSGTSTLEIMRYGVPQIVVYKITSITAFILKRYITTPYFALNNIILNEEVIPELIQENCTPEKIAGELYNLLTDKEKQLYQKEKFKITLERFGANLPNKPSIIAAQKIVELL